MSTVGDYGILLNKDAKLHRKWFNEMVKLIGVIAIYKSPVNATKVYTLNGEFAPMEYNEGIKVGCIFEDHEDQKTAKKLGWDSELLENAALIHVPYDLNNLQVGCLFEIPSAYDDTASRLFRVTKMSAKMIYPASITCEIVPEYIDTAAKTETQIFSGSDFNLLYEG